MPNLTGRQIAAICAGNALEFYDFVVYAIFAAQIGRAFFPSERPGVSLLASLATFGVGFATRPLGAFVIGRFADRAGRRPAMIVSFSLIGLSVGGLALTPGYASIGMAAPVLAVLFRLLQGFALGGEVGPSTALLLESAPIRRRGLIVSLQAMSADGAIMIAGLVGVSLSSALQRFPRLLYRWGFPRAWFFDSGSGPDRGVRDGCRECCHRMFESGWSPRLMVGCHAEPRRHGSG